MSCEKPLYRLSKALETRWANPENCAARRGAGGQANHGRKGSPCRGALKSGETWVLAEGRGCGTVRRIWVTMGDRSPEMMRGIVLRMYWDGATRPAVEAPLGDFFMNPLGRCAVFSSEWFSNPERRNWNCHLPMPFRREFRITATNESPRDQGMFWYHIDYTLGDEHGGDAGYLHAHYRRENPTALRRDFTILPRVEGWGRFLGCNLGVVTYSARWGGTWWGEGEVKIFLDGDTDSPTLCGTGTEDYICSSWGIGNFSLPWYGCWFPAVQEGENARVAMYRLHGPDPVWFRSECRVTIQQIGWAGTEQMLEIMKRTGINEIVTCGDGTGGITRADLEKGAPLGLFERQDDWCATAYFYLDRPESSLPPIEPYEARIASLTPDPGPARRQDA